MKTLTPKERMNLVKKLSRAAARTRTRLSDVVKAARDAGAEVSVSLKPKFTPYWQIAYQSESGLLSSVGLNSQLAVVQMVARLLDAEGITKS